MSRWREYASTKTWCAVCSTILVENAIRHAPSREYGCRHASPKTERPSSSASPTPERAYRPRCAKRSSIPSFRWRGATRGRARGTRARPHVLQDRRRGPRRSHLGRRRLARCGVLREVADRCLTEANTTRVSRAAPRRRAGRDGRHRARREHPFVNVQTEKLFGYGRAELLGQPLDLLIPERFRRGHGAHVAGYFAAPLTRPMGPARALRPPQGRHRDPHRGEPQPCERRPAACGRSGDSRHQRAKTHRSRRQAKRRSSRERRREHPRRLRALRREQSPRALQQRLPPSVGERHRARSSGGPTGAARCVER